MVVEVVVVAAVVVFGRGCFCPWSYAQRNLYSLALLAGFDPGDMPEGYHTTTTTTTKYFSKRSLAVFTLETDNSSDNSSPVKDG